MLMRMLGGRTSDGRGGGWPAAGRENAFTARSGVTTPFASFSYALTLFSNRRRTRSNAGHICWHDPTNEIASDKALLLSGESTRFSDSILVLSTPRICCNVSYCSWSPFPVASICCTCCWFCRSQGCACTTIGSRICGLGVIHGLVREWLLSRALFANPRAAGSCCCADCT